jgi:hypothetical protein
MENKHCGQFKENACPFSVNGICVFGKRKLDKWKIRYWRFRQMKLTAAESWWLECDVLAKPMSLAFQTKDALPVLKNFIRSFAEVLSRIG